MSVILEADDLNVDDYIAVHATKYHRILPSRESAWAIRQLILVRPPVPLGIPLRILGISLPFVVCSLLEPGDNESGPVILDLRTVQVCRLDEDFIDAIKRFPVSMAEHEQGCENDNA